MAAPIKHTCPDIDKYIKSIKREIIKERDLKHFSEKELYNTCVSMSNELEYCIDYLEDLRKSNEALREWGEGLDKELRDAADIIWELENKTEQEKTVL